MFSFLEMLEISYVNNVGIIASHPKMTAINTAIEVDLTGQVCADSIGTRMYSGFGGQVEFIRGAAEGFDGKGKPIIALTSTTNMGESKISPMLKKGAGVVTSRGHVHNRIRNRITVRKVTSPEGTCSYQNCSSRPQRSFGKVRL